MARRARNEILYEGSYAHVFSRSFKRRPIFQDPLDFETFRDFLTQSSRRHYLEGTPDPLVDPYPNEGLPEEVDKEFFTTGVAIGSELFLLQLSEEAFGSVPVPRRVTVT